VCARGGYFLRADAGPKWVVVRPLATRRESGGGFSVVGVEGTGAHRGKGFEEEVVVRFGATHHAIQVVDGVVEVAVEGGEVSVGAAEAVFILAGKAWEMAAESIWAEW
jgi:hypothetical protein